MEPLSVFRTIWRQRWLAFPAIVLTLVAAALVFVYGPREYESSISYALVDPQVPTAEEIEDNPALKLLNSDNPYLRSSDPDLIANVLITRLNAESTQDVLKRAGLSDSYEATPGEGGQGLIVTITASGDSSRTSLATTRELGRIFQVDLRQIQKVNDADDRYLFTSIVVDQPDRATEKLSSRLRTVIIVMIAGIVLVFGAVSLGNAIDRSRRRRALQSEQPEAPAQDVATPQVPAQHAQGHTDIPHPTIATAPEAPVAPVSNDGPADSPPPPPPASPGTVDASATAPARVVDEGGSTADEHDAPGSEPLAEPGGQDPAIEEETTERSPLRAAATRPGPAAKRPGAPRKPRQRTRVSPSAAPGRDPGPVD